MASTASIHPCSLNGIFCAGARPNCSNSRGETPLHHASKTGAYQIVVALLAAKAKPNVAAGQDGATPLILAAQKGYTEVAEALLAAGVHTCA